jgi:hypothetical protein
MAALPIFMENLFKIPLSRLNTGHRGGQLQHRLDQLQLEPFRTNSRNLPLLAHLVEAPSGLTLDGSAARSMGARDAG